MVFPSHSTPRDLPAFLFSQNPQVRNASLWILHYGFQKNLEILDKPLNHCGVKKISAVFQETAYTPFKFSQLQPQVCLGRRIV